jgi:2-oxoglutarate dehydrogenase E1 component
MFSEFGINAGYIEELFSRFRESPQAVDPEWRTFFEEYEAQHAPGTNGVVAPLAPPSLGKANGNGAAAPAATAVRRETLLAAAAIQGRVYQLVNAYRVRGHLFAHVDPLSNGGGPRAQVLGAAPELDLSNFGLSPADLDTHFPTVGVAGLPEHATLRQIVSHLEETYCSSIGVEFTHIEDPEAREWLQTQMESTRNRCQLNRDEVLRVLTKLTDAEMFEQFIHRNFVNAKRFSLEGGESLIPLIDALVEEAGAHGIQEMVLGMAHRGRLNVLANILEKNVREIFAAFNDKQPEKFLGRGDVKYHLGYSTDRATASGQTVHLSLTFNPSHLEFVNPVVEGRVRAKQDRGKRQGVIPLLIHGDAAFMGQGVVAETLNLAGLEGYTTGGTIHVVVNNQIGFTTLPEDSRSTRYCTDITRMMKVPVFHVNGEDPEAVIQVVRLATEFRQRYGKDVVIDMYCYRKYGHNEGDEPRFTQPLMYQLVDQKPTVREMYVKRLEKAGLVTTEQADAIVAERRAALEAALEEAKKGDYLRDPRSMEGVWSGYNGGPEKNIPEVDTRVPRETLLELVDRLAAVPEGFHGNNKVLKVLEQRRERAHANQPLDWGAAEHLAFATILREGVPIRLTGQDSRRGTFSHRHAALVDTNTGARWVPLAQLPNAARFEVYDSPLSEAGVLGFEYGYSLDSPDALVMWEAQFGDFLNGAQVIVDQFLVSAEDKWSRLSGIVLLLPHGYEGQGPEHSSARIERFLQMSAEDNIQVMNLTTPAQYFHALRRQVLRKWRKPLVIFTPKSLLRLPAASSTLADLSEGHFQRIIPDPTVDPKSARRILLCSGKVYYDLLDARQKQGKTDIAIMRLEQIYPLSDSVRQALAPYPKEVPLMWVQEEPRNMGAWYFLNANLRELLDGREMTVASRAASSSPATGSKASHDLEQKMLVEEALK